MNLLISMRAFFALIFFIFFLTATAFSQTDYSTDKKAQTYIASTFSYFEKGEYRKTVEELNYFEEYLFDSKTENEKLLGLIAYWRAIALKRLNEFPQALDEFRVAVKYKHDAKDLESAGSAAQGSMQKR